MNSRDQRLNDAWVALVEDNEHKALNLAIPFASEGDHEACTICALAYLYLGESDLCDHWTLKAGELGAREIWLDSQSENHQLSILICRFDTLSTLGTEEFNPVLGQMALEKYLLDPSAEFAAYYSMKAIRNMWESEIVNKDVNNLAKFLVVWIWNSEFDDQTIKSILSFLRVCTSGALSTKESNFLISIIEESLVKGEI